MLDRDLAEMYGVETKRLNEAARRNIERFDGEDFMFQFSKEEFKNWKSQFATSNEKVSQNVTPNSIKMGLRKAPYAFTELGVAMLSSVLNSKTAIKVNRDIMRAFVALRHFALNYAELNRKLEEFMSETDTKFNDVYQVLTALVEQKKIDEKPRKPIGFEHYDKEK